MSQLHGPPCLALRLLHKDANACGQSHALTSQDADLQHAEPNSWCPNMHLATKKAGPAKPSLVPSSIYERWVCLALATMPIRQQLALHAEDI